MKRKSNVQLEEGPEAFSNFRQLLKRIISVPKKAIEAEEARWRANRPPKKKPARG